MDKNRIFGLDLLRAIAILFVLIIHGNHILSPLISDNYRHYLYLPLVDGVDIFFVLSGFLIGKIIFKTFVVQNSEISFKTLQTFWFRRWFRTLPLYFTLLFFLYLYYVFYLNYNVISFRSFLNFIFFIQNFISPHPKFYEEAWSLAVEEWFYILFPVVIFIINRFFRINVNKKSILPVVTIFILAPLLSRIYIINHLHISSYEMYDLYIRKLVVTRLDAIMYGVLVAYIYSYKKEMWMYLSNYNYCILGIVLVYLGKINAAFNLIVFDNPYIVLSTVFTPLSCLGVCLMIPFLMTIKNPDTLFSKITFHTSKISYSLYLIHSTIIIGIIINNFPVVFGNIFLDVFMKYIMYFGISYAIATLTYNFIELPFLNFRDKYFR